MKRAQSAPLVVALLAIVAGTSLAGPKPKAKETRMPAAIVDTTRIDTASLPLQCRAYQHIGETNNALYPWMQRMSLAACRQEITLTAVRRVDEMVVMISTLRAAMAPSIAIYKDAMARGPNEVKILAAYGLGRTYVDMIVRARTAIHGVDQSMLAYGGNGYGGTAFLNRSLALHYALEPMLKAEHDGALEAFRQVAQLAEDDPAAARANAIMPIAITTARVESMILR